MRNYEGPHLAESQRHLSDGSRFYERQERGLGSYFRKCLIDDIARLEITAGVYQVVSEGFYRSVSQRFPFSIYYLVKPDRVVVSAILDSRRDPDWIRKQLE